MTQSEIDAYNAGVMAVLNVAAATAATASAIGNERGWKPTREGAAEALKGLAESGRALLIGDASTDGESGPTPSPVVPGGNLPANHVSPQVAAKP